MAVKQPRGMEQHGEEHPSPHSVPHPTAPVWAGGFVEGMGPEAYVPPTPPPREREREGQGPPPAPVPPPPGTAPGAGQPPPPAGAATDTARGPAAAPPPPGTAGGTPPPETRGGPPPPGTAPGAGQPPPPPPREREREGQGPPPPPGSVPPLPETTPAVAPTPSQPVAPATFVRAVIEAAQETGRAAAGAAVGYARAVKNDPVTFAKDLLIPGHATLRRWDELTPYERAQMIAMDVAMAALLIAPVARVAGRALDAARLAREIAIA